MQATASIIPNAWLHPVQIAELAMLEDDPEDYADKAVVSCAIDLVTAGVSADVVVERMMTIIAAFQSRINGHRWGHA